MIDLVTFMQAHTTPSSSPSEPTFKNLSALLEEGVAQGAFPGAVGLIGRGNKILFEHAVGSKSIKSNRNEAGNPPMTLDCVFDVAGLTSVLVTSILLFRLMDEGKINLTDKVSRFLQGFGVHGKSKISIEQLLNHTSGLPQWVPFFEEILQENTGPRLGIMTSRSAREFVYNQIQRLQLKTEPGTKQAYSDLGAILIGHIAELLTGLSLDKAAVRYVFQPLLMKSSSYIDLSMIRRRGIHPVTDLIAATEECSWRKRVLCGEVHDDNAWAMGGIAGHAGLFTTIRDTFQFASELHACLHGESSFISQQTLSEVFASQDTHYRGGFETPSKENGMVDVGFSPLAFGLNGFTGCSMWLEPQAKLSVLLFTNRIHPSRSNKRISAFRHEFYKQALQSMK